jgi:hypothetical protein
MKWILAERLSVEDLHEWKGVGVNTSGRLYG